jgi:hypothetical protein
MDTNFPEEFFDINLKNRHIYKYKANVGKEISSSKKIAFVGICRNVEDTLSLNIERIIRTAHGFKDYSIYLYENDSIDNTVEVIKSYSSKVKLNFLSECRADKNYREEIDNGSDPWHYNRCRILADCRNTYLDYVFKNLPDYDYLCVLDLDIKGGWSYDGLSHAIFTLESSPKHACVSAYGVLSEPTNTACIESYDTKSLIMYDSLAFRPLNMQQGIHILRTPAFNKITFDRGDDPIEVLSNFGGMAIYRLSLLKNKKYGAKQWKEGEVDPDHVILNRQLVEEGYKIILDPNMIVSYSDHQFSRNTNDKLTIPY